MRRRTFVQAIGLTAVAVPRAVKAQQARKQYHVGILLPAAAQWSPAQEGVFRETLRELGYNDGANLAIELRDAAGRLERLPQLAGELVRANVDVIVAVNTPGTRAAIDATKTIPIIMGLVGDPLATGLVSSLSRPGGNVTGVSVQIGELAAKRLQLLKEAVPTASRIAVLMNPDDPIVEPQIPDTKTAADRLGIETQFLAVRDVSDLEGAFAMLLEWRAEAILRLAGQGQTVAQPTIELALRHRLPTMLILKSDVTAGALMSYDTDRVEAFRRVAHHVDEILKGAKPADLPVEQPTKFELVVNLKTAKAIGLPLPHSIVTRADQVIE